jgi:hypothetical protein
VPVQPALSIRAAAGWWEPRRPSARGEVGEVGARSQGDSDQPEETKSRTRLSPRVGLQPAEYSPRSLFDNTGDLEAAEQAQHLTDWTAGTGSKLIGMHRVMAEEPGQLTLLG